MKFHGIKLLGKFILEKVSQLPDFDSVRDEARLVYNLSDKQLYIGDDSNWKVSGGSGGGISWEIIDSDTTLENDQGYLADCSTDPLTLTLPISADEGDVIAVKDYTGNSDTNNITISRNGHSIEGSNVDIVIDKNYYGVELTYSDSVQGWIKTNESGPISKIVDIRPDNISLDDTDTACSFDRVFDIFKTVDFPTDSPGSIWFSFQFPENWTTSGNLEIEVHYSLDTVDDQQTVRIGTQIWMVSNEDQPSGSSPSYGGSDDITSTTSNTNKYYSSYLSNASLSKGTIVQDVKTIVMKLTRDTVNDTYSGNFKLISISVYQS